LREESPVVQIGESTVDVAARRVLRGDDEIHLTPTAWHLLEVLLRRPGKLLSQRQLLACRRSRARLRDRPRQPAGSSWLSCGASSSPTPSRPKHLLNVPGMGYRFEP
jgi:two-component system, OmpR family, KDP operon response regulator KdpE